jgi:hypothetical protein
MGQLLGVRRARHHTKNVNTMAVTAKDSLSYPPATLRMVCAGTIDMTNDATTAAFLSPLHSAVSRPVNRVATAPNHAGKKTHTSLRDMATESPIRPSVFQIVTAVTCIPG